MSATTTLDAVLRAHAARLGDKDCIVTPEGETLSYRTLDARATLFAEFLVEHGVRPGDRLVLAKQNAPETFVALFGAFRAGATVIPLDKNLSAVERENVIRHAEARAVLVDDASAEAFRGFGAALFSFGALPGVDASCALDGTPAGRPLPTVGPDARALMLYTSGTTGSPKAVELSHGGIAHKVAAIKEWFSLGESDRAICLLPTHFGHGLVSVCLSTLNYGGTLVLCRPFDVELLTKLLVLVERFGVTTFSAVPTIIRLLLRLSEAGAPPVKPASLRFITCASSMLHADEIDTFEARFGVPLLNCYGITEGGTWCALSPVDQARLRDSVGSPCGCRIRAVDEQGKPVGPGEVGELQISGPSVMLGYFKDPATTAQAVKDGWLATGDLGRIDEQDRVFLVSRKKELIIRAGANIFPAEIEAVLLRHTGVAEAYVLGLDHPILGESVGACVVLKEGTKATADDLRTHCASFLAPYKCPERIKLVDNVPKTSRGKVVKSALKDVFLTP